MSFLKTRFLFSQQFFTPVLNIIVCACFFFVAKSVIQYTPYSYHAVMLIRSTAHPSYCPSAILHIRPTATSDLRQLFIFVLFEGQVRLRQFLCRALQLGRARGPSAAARTGQRAGRGLDVLVGRMGGRSDGRRSKNAPSIMSCFFIILMFSF